LGRLKEKKEKRGKEKGRRTRASEKQGKKIKGPVERGKIKGSVERGKSRDQWNEGKSRDQWNEGKSRGQWNESTFATMQQQEAKSVEGTRVGAMLTFIVQGSWGIYMLCYMMMVLGIRWFGQVEVVRYEGG